MRDKMRLKESVTEYVIGVLEEQGVKENMQHRKGKKTREWMETIKRSLIPPLQPLRCYKRISTKSTGSPTHTHIYELFRSVQKERLLW